MTKIVQPFSDLLNELLGDYRHATKDLSAKTEALGTKLGVRRINRYRTGESIPPLPIAQLVIEAAGGSFSVEQLKLSLELERERQNDPDDEEDIIYLRLTNEMICNKTGINDPRILEVVKERARSIYPNEKAPVAHYISDLVAKDILEDLI